MEYSLLVRPDCLEDHKKSLSKEIKKTSKRKVPADIKLALLRQDKYRKRLLQDRDQEINIRQKSTTSKSSTGTQSGTNPIIETLPKSLQAKGSSFLSFLQGVPQLKVNEKGEVSYDGEQVEGSRIVDIVHDFTRERPTQSPARGWQLIARALKDNNVPREFIGNRSRWQYIQNLGSTPDTTPKRPNLSRTLSDLQSLRRRLSSQTGSGVSAALKKLKWKTH